MDVLLILISALFMVTGIVGCVVPVLPGPPLSFVGLLLMELQSHPPFSARFMWIWAFVVVLISLLDYLVPQYGTKKFGGSKLGVWGCTIGLMAGFLLGPYGIILGPFTGAFIGELIANKPSGLALKAATGALIGFFASTVLKLSASFMMAGYFAASLL
jgi:uncharacterized protein YqgC (DUF456 family)